MARLTYADDPLAWIEPALEYVIEPRKACPSSGDQGSAVPTGLEHRARIKVEEDTPEEAEGG